MKKAVALLTALVCLTAIPSSCGISQNDGTVSVNADLTTEEMLADYDCMWHIIESEWPYLTLAEKGGFFREQPIDWRQVRDAYRKQLEEPILFSEGRYAYNGRVLSHNEFFVAVCKDSISPFSSAGHLFVLDADWYFPDFSAFDYSDKSRAFYESLPKSEEPKNIGIDKEKGASLYHIGDTPVIKLSSFAMAYSDEAAAEVIKKIDDFCAQNIDSADFIIDIRGNSGGNSAIWQEGLRRILLSKDDDFKRLSGIAEDSVPFYEGEGMTVVNLKDDERNVISPQVKERLLEAGLTHAVIGRFDKEMIYNGNLLKEEQIPPYNGNVWLLADGNVCSSAEMLVIFAKETGAATIVGNRTGGDGMALEGTPKINALPNSGLMFVCSRELPMNADGSYNPFSGTLPDIEVEKDGDALELCLELIQGK